VAGGTAGAVLALLAQRGVTVTQNPDVLRMTYTELSVDDARTLASYAFLKSIGESKYFIVTFDRAGGEAQNALLKVVEEAPGGTIFFFCTPTAGTLLPTLRSRCIELGSHDTTVTNGDAIAFLKLSYPDRLALVEKLVTAAQKAGDRTEIREFARRLVAAHPSRATLDAVQFLEQNGTSPKLVLSHLAVSLPHE
jgi:hypothetical protein